MRAPVTQANLNFLASWQSREGGSTANGAKWNYLNIESTSIGNRYPYFVSSNGGHIAIFPSYGVGVAELAAYLRQYPSVVQGLTSGNPYSPTLRQGMLGDLSTFLSGSRTGGLSYGAAVLGTSTNVPLGGAYKGLPVLSGGQEQAAGLFGSKLPSWVTQGLFFGVPGIGPAGGVTNTIGRAVIPGFASTEDALAWVSNNWDRVLEVLAGAGMVLVGIILVARQQLGGKVPGAAAIGAATGSFVGEREYARHGSPPPAVRDRSLSKREVYNPEARAPRQSSGKTVSHEVPGDPFAGL